MSTQQTRNDGPKARALAAAPAPRRRTLRRFWFPAVLLLALSAGGLTGIVLAYSLNYSRAAEEVKALATYRPSVVTRVYADDEETIIGTFALERRVPLKFAEIPANVQNAILAVEDVRFFKHQGIDPVRIMGAVWKNVRTGRARGLDADRQLAKRLFSRLEDLYAQARVVARSRSNLRHKQRSWRCTSTTSPRRAPTARGGGEPTSAAGQDLSVEGRRLAASEGARQLSQRQHEGGHEKRDLVISHGEQRLSRRRADRQVRPITHESATRSSLSRLARFVPVESTQQLEDRHDALAKGA